MNRSDDGVTDRARSLQAGVRVDGPDDLGWTDVVGVFDVDHAGLVVSERTGRSERLVEIEESPQNLGPLRAAHAIPLTGHTVNRASATRKVQPSQARQEMAAWRGSFSRR